MTDHDALMVLNAVNGLGNARITKLIETFGSARDVFNVSQKNLSDAQVIPAEVAANLIHFPKDEFLKSESELIKNLNLNVLSLWDEGYPSNLKQIPDAPVIMYQRGDFDLNQMMGLAIVGSRKASIYGLTIARQFA